MKPIRRALTGLVAIFALTSGALAQEAPERSPIQLDYSIYFGGFNVIALGIDVNMTGDEYDVTVRTSTIGVAAWFAPWKAVNTSAGAVRGSVLAPRRHRANGEFRGNLRTVAIDYEGGEVSRVTVRPVPRDDFGRDEVPREAMRGAIDPSSAVLAVTRRIAAGGGCGGRVAVFDGRRRYDVVVVERGPEILPPNDHNSFSGRALRCDFHVEQIAGYNMKNAEPDMRKQRFRTGRAWFAELWPGRPVVPVRIDVDGDVAATLVHLRDARRAVAADQEDKTVD